MKNFLQFCGYVLMQSTDEERKIKWKKLASKWYVQYFNVVQSAYCSMYYFCTKRPSYIATYIYTANIYIT